MSTNFFDKDNYDTLEPALKVNQGWTPAKLKAWVTAQLALLGAVAVLGEYSSQAGQKLSNIGLLLATDPDPKHAVASLYFGDNGEWWLSHNQTSAGRQLVYRLYNELITQGIAVKFPDWIKTNFAFELPKIESAQPVVEVVQDTDPIRPVVAVKFTQKQIDKAKERTRKFKEFNDTHPTGYTPEAAALASTGKSYRTIQRDLEILEVMQQSV